MNKTIYLNTLKKILKHKFVLTLIVLMSVAMPLNLVTPSASGIDTNTLRDSFLTIFLLGMLIITLTNPFPVTISMSGRMDYMPLIVTRPVNRWQYVVSKWLALSTVLCGTTVIQEIIYAACLYIKDNDFNTLVIASSLLDRVLIGMSMSSVLTFVYLLPTEMTILIGILAIQLAAATHLFPLGFATAHTETSETATVMTFKILGLYEWFNDKIFPVLFGSGSQESVGDYLKFFHEFAQFMAPNIHTYDLLTARPLFLSPLLQIVSNISIALLAATITLNVREFHYDTD